AAVAGSRPERRHRGRHPAPAAGLPRRDRAAAGVLRRPSGHHRRSGRHRRGHRARAGRAQATVVSLFAGRGKRIERKTRGELEAMRAAGLVVARTLQAVVEAARPGVSTGELDELAEQTIRDAGAVPSFKGYHGFPASLCTSVNEQVVHGIPSRKAVLAEGDLLSVDCGAILDGWHGDSAVTIGIGSVSAADQALSEATKAAMNAGI